MTCSCGRYVVLEKANKDWPAVWGDRQNFPRYITSGVCGSCGDTLNADGTVTRAAATCELPLA